MDVRDFRLQRSHHAAPTVESTAIARITTGLGVGLIVTLAAGCRANTTTATAERPATTPPSVQRQTAPVTSQAQEVRARADLNQAIAALNRALGVTLERHGVSLQNASNPTS
jgi:hypothetical protein